MQNDKFWLRIIYILSTVISLAVAFLILGPRPEVMEGLIDVSGLPLVNSVLNGITTILLVFAFIAIKNKNIELHKKLINHEKFINSNFNVTWLDKEKII